MPPKKAPRVWAMESAKRILAGMEEAAELEANRKALQRKKDAEHRLRLRTGKPSTATAPTAVEAKAEATPAGGENKDDAECDLASRKAEAKNLLRRFDKDPDSVTLSDLVETVARLGLEGKEAVEEEDAMKKQLVAQLREELPATPRKARTSERAPRRPGREKGTILWRVQPEFGDILVKDPEVDPHGPGDMSFVQAVKSARPGARIFVRGHHSWSGFLELDKCVHIVGAGAWVTKLTGRWWLQHYADLPEQDAEMDTLAVFSSIRPVVAGFSGVELTHVAGRDRTLNLVGNYMAETVVVQGGSWRFHACKLTCSGAPPLVTAARSLVKMLECRVGGIDQDTHRASSGVVVTGESRCCLHTCVIEYTDNQDYTQVVDSLPEIKRAASPRKDAGSAGGGGGFLGAKSKPAGLAGGLLGGKGGGGMGGLFGGRSLAPKTDAPPTIGDVLSKFRSAAVVVRHTGKAELDCCQLLNNYMAVAVSDCGAVRSYNSLFHEHNKGGIFGFMSQGNGVRDSVLEIKDNKVARTQDKNFTALGRPGQLTRRDGLGTWEELSKETKIALGRLEALFETEKSLYTNMVLPAHFILAIDKRTDEYAGSGAQTKAIPTPRGTPRKTSSTAGTAGVAVSITLDVH